MTDRSHVNPEGTGGRPRSVRPGGLRRLLQIRSCAGTIRRCIVRPGRPSYGLGRWTAARRGHAPPSPFSPAVSGPPGWARRAGAGCYPCEPGRVAQRESARLTRERSQVQNLPRPPSDPGKSRGSGCVPSSATPRGDHMSETCFDPRELEQPHTCPGRCACYANHHCAPGCACTSCPHSSVGHLSPKEHAAFVRDAARDQGTE